MSTADIVKAYQEVTSKDSKTHSKWVKPYSFNKDNKDKHQFIFFFKPEVTSNQDVKLDKILDHALEALHKAGVEVGAIRVIAGDYLEKNNVMVEHYGVISKISKEGVKAISQEAKTNLETKYKDDLAAGVKVLGGHEFLAQQKEFNPFSLIVLNDNLGTVRLAGGTYAMKIKVLGQPVIILNPFHAYQLVPYTTSGHGIIVLEGLSKLPWKDLRNKVCGVTDPKDAVSGSIRNLLLTHKDDFGLKDVDKGTNGVHMSAGPLEGMVELARFFSDKDAGKSLTYGDTAFGALLESKGVSHSNVDKLATNPDFDIDGKKVSAFDLTEEKDAETASTTLTSKL